MFVLFSCDVSSNAKTLPLQPPRPLPMVGPQIPKVLALQPRYYIGGSGQEIPY
jgi:hypothetical protein